LGDIVVDILGTGIGVESADLEGEALEQERDHREQIGLTNAFDRGD
jgi:hypothetical protein